MLTTETSPRLKTDKKAPQVTIVVVPRERFSYTQKSLESIYEHTTIPFKLVYVDGGSPGPIRDYLREQSQAKGFTLIRMANYLSPNLARNIGVSQVDTEYTVFIDNDVVVAPYWLDYLEVDSLDHLQEKWNLSGDSAFFKMRRRRLGWRRQIWVIKPIARRLSFGQPNPWLETVLMRVDRVVNSYLSDRYKRKRAGMQLPVPVKFRLNTVSRDRGR